MSTTHIIPSKSSGEGSIHDIASEHGDRAIRFAPGCKFAVVRASYYGGLGYTTHRTEAAAAHASHAQRAYSHAIIDTAGVEYVAHYGDTLVRR